MMWVALECPCECVCEGTEFGRVVCASFGADVVRFVFVVDDGSPRFVCALRGVICVSVSIAECEKAPAGFWWWTVWSALFARVVARSVSVDNARCCWELWRWCWISCGVLLN